MGRSGPPSSKGKAINYICLLLTRESNIGVFHEDLIHIARTIIFLEELKLIRARK